MSSTSVGLTALPARSKSNNSAKPDLWEEALNTLSAEDRKQYAHSIYDPLEVLKKVCGHFDTIPQIHWRRLE